MNDDIICEYCGDIITPEQFDNGVEYITIIRNVDIFDNIYYKRCCKRCLENNPKIMFGYR